MKKMLLILVSSVLFVSSSLAVLPFDPITVDFSATDPGYPGGPVMGIGSFTYNAAAIMGVGPEEVSIYNSGLIGFTFEVFGQTFTETDDTDYPFFPVVDFVNGIPDQMVFVVEDSVTPIDEPNVDAILLGIPIVSDGLGGYTTDMTILVVPEPTTFTLIGLGSLALVMVRRRR